MTAATVPESRRPPAPAIHPGWLRLTHWLNALAVLVMIASGWRIYNASPLYDFSFPRDYTLGGWLGGALQWHFAGMWLLGLNGLLYLALNLASGGCAANSSPEPARRARRPGAARGRLARRSAPLQPGAAAGLSVRDAGYHGAGAVRAGVEVGAVQRCANCWAATRWRAISISMRWRCWSPSSSSTWRWWRWCRAACSP